MVHSFDVEIAERYGLLEAVLLNNLYYWIEKNRANEVNFFDGTYWTYNSTRAFNELFPYVSERQIKNALKHLREEGILLTGNYNKSAYDRTLWYALSEKGLSIVQKCPMENTTEDNGSCNDVPPIPNIKPNIKPNNKPNDVYSGPELINSEPEQAETADANTPDTVPAETAITLQLVTGEEYPVDKKDVLFWGEMYPAVDVMQELRKMKDWLLSNPKRRKTKRGIKRFISGWLAKEQDRGGRRSVGNNVRDMTTEQYLESIRGWND